MKIINCTLALLLFSLNVPATMITPAFGMEEQVTSGVNVKIGYGLRTPGALSLQRINEIKNKEQDNSVLQQAFKIVEGADRAIAHDFNLLLQEIRERHAEGARLNPESFLDDMREERNIVKKAALALGVKGAYETTYLPFLDQLHALGSQGAILGHSYKGRCGIDKAIGLIKNNWSLFRGEVPEHLQNVTGVDSIALRIALFYIAKAKGSDVRLNDLKTFYRGQYFGDAETKGKVKSLLQKTRFYEDGLFYAPDNGYIKNGDQSNMVNGKKGMVFSDCSGFAQSIARFFHPNHTFLANNRVMSYQLAPLYDSLMNQRMGTKKGLYVNGKRKRDLTNAEQNAISQYSLTIQKLKDVYEPVYHRQNIQPGDILVQRNYYGYEGHVMIVAGRQGNTVEILELTGFGQNRGYKWRKENLSDDTYGYFHRILRLKQS
jgi:hypothetical protein